jgi:hypothetical protein
MREEKAVRNKQKQEVAQRIQPYFIAVGLNAEDAGDQRNRKEEAQRS